MYKIRGESVQRLSDGACIPNNTSNRDYQEYLEWLSLGNVPEPEYTVSEIREQVRQRIKQEASFIIISHYPMWKQNNLLARWLELKEKEITLYTPEEQAEVNNIKAVWDWVKSIRAQSNTFEQEVTVSDDPSSYTYEFII